MKRGEDFIDLSVLHEIHIKVVPKYLTSLILVLAGETPYHNLWNIDNVTIDKKELGKTKSSYVS